MTAYYNEIDPFAAQWLRELIKHNLIAPGDVDERSIEDVTPAELSGYTQCHFFAGIGVWSYALRQVGWPDDRPVWTGSCPCQPFSTAGKGAGFADERHLWPAFHWLIDQCRPDLVLGEQVAGKDGLTWLDLVSTDLEGSGYACGSAVTAACGFGAPHKRTRLYWVADAAYGRRQGRRRTDGQDRAKVIHDSGPSRLADADGERHDRIDPLLRQGAGRERGAQEVLEAARGGESSGMADTQGERSEQGPAVARGWSAGSNEGEGAERECCSDTGSMADANHQGPQGRQRGRDGTNQRTAGSCGVGGEGRGPTNGFWRDADWLGCRDGKWRPVEPSTFPLADGAPARVGRLRGYGNAIVAQQAQAFIEAYLES